MKRWWSVHIKFPVYASCVRLISLSCSYVPTLLLQYWDGDTPGSPRSCAGGQLSTWPHHMTDWCLMAGLLMLRAFLTSRPGQLCPDLDVRNVLRPLFLCHGYRLPFQSMLQYTTNTGATTNYKLLSAVRPKFPKSFWKHRKARVPYGLMMSTRHKYKYVNHSTICWIQELRTSRESSTPEVNFRMRQACLYK